MRKVLDNFDYLGKDYESFRQLMLDNLKIKMPEYTDLRSSDAGVVILELLAIGLDIVSLYQDNIANEMFLSTAEQKESVLKWAKMLGYVPRQAIPSRYKQVFVLNEVSTNDTVIPKGTVIKTQSSNLEEEVLFETVEDFIIPKGKLGNEKDNADKEYLYQAEIVQGYSIHNELLGSSDGTKGQKFKIGYNPVLKDSISLVVNEGTGFEEWTQVSTFVDSFSTDKHFLVNTIDNESEIVFGDGVFGKIPNVYEDGIYISYRVGGGDVGNVGALKITELDGSLSFIKETFNPSEPFVSGVNSENNEEIKINAPNLYRINESALTIDDFREILLRNYPYIKLINVVRDSNDVDNLIIYILLNDTDVTLPTAFKKELEDFFDENKGGRKIVGAKKIVIEQATLKYLNLSANLIVEDFYLRANVKKKVTDFIKEYFKLGRYPFGKYLSYTQLANEVMRNVQGIKSFRFTNFGSEEVVVPRPNELLSINSDISLAVSGGE